MRYEVLHAGRMWHVDEFAGANAGLVLAEVELDHPAQAVTLPDWVGQEVTSDERYHNSHLADAPQRYGRTELAARPAPTEDKCLLGYETVECALP